MVCAARRSGGIYMRFQVLSEGAEFFCDTLGKRPIACEITDALRTIIKEEEKWQAKRSE